MSVKLLGGTIESLNIESYDEFAEKYVRQNELGYNSTAITFEEDILKISAPKFSSGQHYTLYITEDQLIKQTLSRNIKEALYTLMEDILLKTEFILQQKHLDLIKKSLTLEKIFDIK